MNKLQITAYLLLILWICGIFISRYYFGRIAAWSYIISGVILTCILKVVEQGMIIKND